MMDNVKNAVSSSDSNRSSINTDGYRGDLSASRNVYEIYKLIRDSQKQENDWTVSFFLNS